jgi:hypothetical protein
MAVWSAFRVLTVALNCPVTEPEATVTVDGTASAARLLESETVAPPEPAAFDRLTVQAKMIDVDRLLRKHDTALSTVGATKPMLNVLELAL